MFQYSSRDAVSLLPTGDYQAEVASAEETVSKASGNPMLKIKFNVFHGERKIPIFEYIVQKTTYKYGHIARALGEEKAFEDDIFDINQHVGKLLTLTIGIEKGEVGKRDSNRIMAYNPGSFEPEALAAVEAATQKDDEIPW